MDAEASEAVREPNREPRRDRSPNDSARAEGRTRDVNEDRTPVDLDQSKRRPRRDRASLARSQGEERRPQPIAEPVEEVVAGVPSTSTASESIEAAAPHGGRGFCNIVRKRGARVRIRNGVDLRSADVRSTEL